MLYVEDPGAATYIAGVPAGLAARGASVQVHAAAGGASQLERLQVSYRPVSGDEPVRLFRASPPQLVAVGTSENPDTPAFALVAEARAAGVPTAGLVDGPANAAHRFRGRTARPLAHAPDWILVPDAPTRDQYVNLGHPADRVVACGHPRMDTVRAERKRLEGEGAVAIRTRLWGAETAGRRVILFAAETSDGLDESSFRRTAGYTLAGWGGSDRRTDIVLEEFLDAVNAEAPDALLVLRLHPKNTVEEFQPYLSRFAVVSRMEPVLDACFAADAVVGLTSILLAEAAVLGVPTLSIVPRAEESAWLATAGKGTRVATDGLGIRRELGDMLAGRGGFPAAAVDQCFPPGATTRVADTLLALATAH